MPIRVEIEGQGVVAEFPDGTDPAVIDAAVQRDYFGKKPMGLPSQRDRQAEMIAGMSPTERFMVGVGSGMNKVYKGAKQLGMRAAEALGADVGADEFTRQEQADQALMEPLKRESIAAKVGEVVGETAPMLAVPGGVTGGALKRAATSALAGAATGAVQFTPEGGSKGTQALVGGLAGGAGSAVLSGVPKLGNAVLAPAAKNVTRKLADKFGIPLSLGEETGSIGAQRAEVMLERAPGFLGNMGFRKKQAEAASAAAKSHFAQYVADPTLATTAEMKEANDTLLDSLYAKVRANAKTVPKATAPEVKKATSELLDRYPTVFESIQDGKVKGILSDVYGDTKDKVVKSPVLGPNGQPITRTVTPTFSFDDLWELRKGIGKEMRDARTDTARSQLGRIYAAVSDDVESMLSGGAAKDFKAANDAFKKYSVKFDALREAYDKATGTTGAGEMFSPKKYSTALKNLANNPKNQQKFKWEPGEVEHMTGLANILQVVKRAGQYAENPPTGNRWGPLGALVGSVAPAAAYAGSGATAAGAAAVPAGASLVAKFLTSTEAGKKLAMAASKVEPTNQLMRNIVNQVYQQLPKFAAMEAASARQEPTE